MGRGRNGTRAQWDGDIMGGVVVCVVCACGVCICVCMGVCARARVLINFIGI